ncbi:hypothetical protein [Reyranella sp.]|jgi:hypothetical protein|uniref:hypothetical protein n=1 Tax=Reyranella sp. TaxID=1929291 RepID=UPI0026217AF0|nr:hypothetical protein [Reyranella sp.]HQS18784.1 hypothetical protein [Reyranella sp.]HQT14906.1 hypothetical protein [Reyranella sp.]
MTPARLSQGIVDPPTPRLHARLRCSKSTSFVENGEALPSPTLTSVHNQAHLPKINLVLLLLIDVGTKLMAFTHAAAIDARPEG